MSRNNLPQSEQIVPAEKQELVGKKKVRAVHAVLMRWVTEGMTPEEILSENPKSIQEFVAQRYVRNLFDSASGSKVGLQAAKELRLLIDGNDDPTGGVPMIPVTYVQRLIEGDGGEVTKEKEIRHTVQLALPEESNG